jgi:ribosome-associated heat shock protein Hsp15
MTRDVAAATVRIDKWLWAARFFKTRALAVQAVESGGVRVDQQRVKPARHLRLHELVTERDHERLEVVVCALYETRGPAAFAQRLYAETPESLERRTRMAESRRLAREPALSLKGRPTKRDARRLQRLTSSTTADDST